MRTMIHVYFLFGLSTPAHPAYQQFQIVNAVSFKKDRNPLQDGMENAQRATIANKYVNQMADILYKYELSRKIPAPANSGLSILDYCKDLSLGGLMSTKAYRKYAQNKARTEQTIANERANNSNSTQIKRLLEYES
jgi:hypothetical protein